jgi:ribosome assembly protein YihI (activator of Der GTPase)
MNLKQNKWEHHKITRTLDGSITSLQKIESEHLKNELLNKLNAGNTDIGSKLREYFEETIFEIIEH